MLTIYTDQGRKIQFKNDICFYEKKDTNKGILATELYIKNDKKIEYLGTICNCYKNEYYILNEDYIIIYSYDENQDKKILIKKIFDISAFQILNCDIATSFIIFNQVFEQQQKQEKRKILTRTYV